MKKAIIFGTGLLADVVCYFLDKEKNFEVCGYTVDSQYLNSSEYMGLPLIGFEDVEKVFPPEDYGIFICMGYTNMNTVREEKFYIAEKKGYEILSYRHSTAIVNAKSVGKGNIIMENVIIGPFSEIGDGNIFYPNTNLAHHVKVNNFNLFAASSSIAGCCSIGSNCFLGINCTVKNNIVIADKTLVGGACYISKNTKPCGVYAARSAVKLDRFDSLQMSELL